MTSSHRPPPGRVLAGIGIGIGIGLLMVTASAATAATALASPAPPAPAHSSALGQAVGVSCNAFGPTLFVRLPSQLSSLPAAAAPELKGFPDCLHGMNPSGG
ncbi:hypothetical protein ACFQ6V_00400 [Streptomyces roseifaciens]